jgi:hemerythrin
MSLIWREQLSVGNDVLDLDHRRLIDIINQVERCLGTKNHNELYVGLYSLSQFAHKHIAREEKIARAAGYPGIAHMVQCHESLLKQLGQVKQDIEEMGLEWSSAAIANLNQFMRDWMIGHIIKEDLLMKDTLKKFPPGFNPA